LERALCLKFAENVDLALVRAYTSGGKSTRRSMGEAMSRRVGHADPATAFDDSAPPIPSLADLSQGPRFRGGIDGLRNGRLSGWAVDLLNPGLPLRASLIVEGVVLKTLQTSMTRPDLLPFLSPNIAGFQFEFASLDATARATVVSKLSAFDEATLDWPCDMRAAIGDGSGIELTAPGITRRVMRDSLGPRKALDEHAPAIAALKNRDSGPRFRGGVDQLKEGRLSGWAIDLLDPCSGTRAKFILEGVALGEVTTSIRRVGLDPYVPGNLAGFAVDLWQWGEDGPKQVIAFLESLPEEMLESPCSLLVSLGADSSSFDVDRLGIDRADLLAQLEFATPSPLLVGTVTASASTLPESFEVPVGPGAAPELDQHAPAIPSLVNLRSGAQFRGGVDHLRDGRLSGWAIDLVDPRKPASIKLTVEGVVFGEAATSAPRVELDSYVPGNVAGFVVDLWQWGETGPAKVIALLENLSDEALDSPCRLVVGLGASSFDAARVGITRASLLAQLELATPSSTDEPLEPSPLPLVPARKPDTAPTPPALEPPADAAVDTEEQPVAVVEAHNERAARLARALEISRVQTMCILQSLGMGLAGFAAHAVRVANDPRRLFAFILEERLARSRHATKVARAHARAIRDLFDPLFYLETWEPTAECNNPLLHYVTAGWKQERQANPLFDVAYYREQAGDIEGDPLLHYVEHGARAGIDPHPLFSTRFYRERYLAGQDINPLLHYQTRGAAMRLDPSPLFDTAYFLSGLPDADAVASPLECFIAHRDALLLSTHPAFDAALYQYQLEVERGQTLSEPAVVHYLRGGYCDRTILPNLLFDPEFYRERNHPDFDGPELVHYLTQGDRAGLACHPLFSSGFYNEQRGDDGLPITALEHALLHPEAGLRTDPRVEKPPDRVIFDFVRRLVDTKAEFDAEFYRLANPDLSKCDDAYLETHFAEHGRKEGRVASPRALLARLKMQVRDIPVGMRADEYIALNPDLAALAGNPLTCLVHYLEHGRRENRMHGFWQLYLDDFVLNLASRSAPRRVAPAKARTQVCVLVHAYYPDLLPELLGFAQNFGEVTSDVVLNIVDLAWNARVHRELRELCPGAFVQLSNDNGRDLGGFMRLLDNIEMDRYELFAFMHTKKSPHIHQKRAEYWRRTLLKAFAGTPAVVRECVSLFGSQTVGMIASKEWRSHHMGKNAGQYEHMLDILGVEGEHRALDYVSGTMFLTRSEIVKRLHSAMRTVEWEYGGDGSVGFHMDGQTAHGAERAIPALVRQMGYEIVWR